MRTSSADLWQRTTRGSLRDRCSSAGGGEFTSRPHQSLIPRDVSERLLVFSDGYCWRLRGGSSGAWRVRLATESLPGGCLNPGDSGRRWFRSSGGGRRLWLGC